MCIFWSDLFAYPTKDAVYQLTASDPDLGDKGWVRYSIIQSQYINTAKRRNISVFDAFKIGSESGQISVGFQSYTYFIGGYFELTIKGEDYLKSELYSTYKLKVRRLVVREIYLKWDFSLVLE